MKLSMSLIEHYLSHYHLQSDLQQDKMVICGVRFLSDQRLKLSPEYVYIGRADQFFSDDHYRDVYLLINGYSRILCFDCDYEELLNDVLAAFEYFNNWEQTLRELCSQQANIQHILDASIQLLDEPTIVSDISGRLIGSVCDEQYLNIPEIKETITQGILPAWVIHRRFLDATGTVIRDLTNQSTRYYTENDAGSAVSMYLCQDNERVGFFQIFEVCKQTSDYHVHIQTVLSKFLLQSGNYVDKGSYLRSNTSLLIQLLNGDTITSEAQEKFIQQTALKFPLQLMDIRSLTIQNKTQRTLAVREYTQCGIPCFALDYEGDVLILLSQKDIDAMVRRIRVTSGLTNSMIGISMPIHDLFRLPGALRQARFVLTYCNGSGIYHCQDYALDYLIDQLRVQELVTELLHPAITTLEQYDHENGTQLLETLSVYLQSDRSHTLTSEKLHTHRNTVKYRLERIFQLTGIDLSDWREQNWLNMSLLIRRNEKK